MAVFGALVWLCALQWAHLGFSLSVGFFFRSFLLSLSHTFEKDLFQDSRKGFFLPSFLLYGFNTCGARVCVSLHDFFVYSVYYTTPKDIFSCVLDHSVFSNSSALLHCVGMVDIFEFLVVLFSLARTAS